MPVSDSGAGLCLIFIIKSGAGNSDRIGSLALSPTGPGIVGLSVSCAAGLSSSESTISASLESPAASRRC
eukprot:746797-Hanusia_phi.AAC.5